jgi:glycerophosphoryl diester phosphodiesterase
LKAATSRPLLLGHRGARIVRRSWVPQVPRASRPGYSDSSCDQPPAENTLAAFDYAIANGCDGFEFDVRCTRDGRSVICHDPRLDRKEIAACDYAAFKESAPCLEDVLERFAATAYLDIELKVAGNEEAVVAALRAHPPERGYVISSFVPDVLLRVHEIDSSLPLGYICDRAEQAQIWAELPIQVFVPHRSLVSQRLIDAVHQREMQVFTWTVNDRDELLRFADWGIDGLISDDPKLLAATFLAKSE